MTFSGRSVEAKSGALENGFASRTRSGVPPRSVRNSMIDVHEAIKNINERIIAINAEQFQDYIAQEPTRVRHNAHHPTAFGCLKCMDGRVHLASATGTPMGIVKPFRAIGGRFEVFWPAFMDRLERWSDEAMYKGNRSFVLVSYHHSVSNKNLCCAGWNHDTAAAKTHAEKLTEKLGYIFSGQMTTVCMGVETDQDLLTFHGPRGDFSGRDFIDRDEGEIAVIVRRCMPQIDDQSLHDLMPFLLGNAERVDELRRNPRDVSHLDHQERVIALGEGFDWLAKQNFALINNDSDPNLDEAIVTAARIIQGNLKSARPDEEATIFTSVPYAQPGQKQRKAVERALGLQEFAQTHIRKQIPELFTSGRLRYLVGVTFESSKELQVIDQGTCG